MGGVFGGNCLGVSHDGLRGRSGTSSNGGRMWTCRAYPNKTLGRRRCLGWKMVGVGGNEVEIDNK